MLSNHVSCDYVVTSVTFYHSALVDLTHSRTVHAVEHDPCCPDPTKLSAADCKAVHYGLCSPLLKLPSFSVPPPTTTTASPPATPKGTTSTPGSPVTPKGSSIIELFGSPPPARVPSTPGSPVTPKGTPIIELFGSPPPVVRVPSTTSGSPILQRSSSPIVVTSPSMSIPSPVMAAGPKMDVELLDPVSLLASNLEDELEALVSTFVAQDKERLAARKKAETMPYKSPNKAISPIKKYDRKINKEERSSGDESSETSSPKPNGLSKLEQNPLETFADKGHMFLVEQRDQLSKQLSAFALHFEDNLHERSSSPSFKSSVLPSLKPSPEYQQTGVKAQINKFASKEKDAFQNSSPTTKGRQSPKAKPTTPEPAPRSSSGPPLTLDALQEMLLSPPADHPIRTAVFQNTRSPPFEPPPQKHHPEPAYLLDDPAPSSLVYLPEAFGKPSQDYVQSAVDYAKTRIQNEASREEPKPKAVKNGHLVSDAKNKWENWNETDPKRVLEGLLGEVASPSIPHPKLTTAQKQHIKERSLSPTDRHVPIRPFLTKGSVAERVLLFERCPDLALERTASGAKSKPNLISTWRPGTSDVHNKTQFWEVVADSDKTFSLEKECSRGSGSSLRRAVGRGGLKSAIPRFYFPAGRPRLDHLEPHLQKVAAVFAGLNDARASREEFAIITKACGVPLYWKLPLFLAARGEDKKSSVGCDAFLEFWKRIVSSYHDEASKFIAILTKEKRSYLINDDFFLMMQDLIHSHPGLTFLKEATEFHSRYIHTVIARIFYCVNRSWSGKITAPELRKSNFLQVLATLEEEEDINQITDFFSYEHFYVIYCKFWELDKDHDLYIDQNDLKLHSGGALSSRIIQRIFSGAVTRGPKQKEGFMSYTEFVWFLISEEDKRHPRSIEYWFRCMDFDGDGYLSMYELEYFYLEQLQRLEALGIETLPFNDCLCQMLDIIKPKVPGKISLADLKKCKMTPIFFDTFFNLEKYLDHEQRDPFASQREHDGEGPELSDWERFAAEEYELLVAEEGAGEQQDELMYYDEEEPNLEKATKHKAPSKNGMNPEEEDYDYADSDDYHY